MWMFSRQPRILCGLQPDGRPIKLTSPLRDGGKETIVKQAGQWKRGRTVGSGLKHQIDILQSQLHSETGRSKTLLRDRAAVGLVRRAGKQGAAQHVRQFASIDSVFFSQHKRLGKRFNGRGQQEVPRQLDDMRSSRFLAKIKRTLPDGIEDGADPLLRRWRAG